MKSNNNIQTSKFKISQIKNELFLELINYLQQSKNIQLQKINNSIIEQSVQSQYLIGEYGQSNVYSGINTITGDRLALKIFSLDKNEFTYMKQEYERLYSIKFLQYALVLSDLIYLEDKSICIQIMELFPSTLEQQIRDRDNKNQPYTSKEIATLISNAINSLFEIHTNGIAHLNIKPSNVLITNDGQYKLSDLQQQLNKRCFYDQNIYNSPEQIQESKNQTCFENINIKLPSASDIYSMGLCLLSAIGLKLNEKTINLIKKSNLRALEELILPEYITFYSFIQHFMLQNVDEERYSAIRLRQRFLEYYDYLISPEEEIIRIQRLLSKYKESKLPIDRNYAYLQLCLSQTNKMNQELSGIEKANSLIDEISLDQTFDKVIVLQEFSKILNNKNQFSKSLESNQLSYEIISKINTIDQKEIAYQLKLIADDYNQIGKYQESLLHYQKALIILQKLFTKHPDIALILDEISYQYYNLKENQLSLTFSTKSFEMRSFLFNCTHPETARSLNRVGISYFGLRLNNESIKYWKQALQMRESLFSKYHQDIAATLDNLGSAYQNLSQYQESLSCKKRALEIRRVVFQDDQHPHLAISYGNIGNVYQMLDQTQEAILANKKALKIRQKLYKDYSHNQLGFSYNNLGNSYMATKQKEKALKYFKKALYVYDHAYSRNAEEIQRTNNNLKAIYKTI